VVSVAAVRIRTTRFRLHLSYHTSVVTEDGWLVTFGSGQFGRLGHSKEADELVPRRVLGALARRRVVQVAVSLYHTLAVTADGKLFSSLSRNNH
jgi:alpha-tubulin suppressor-like RCC1 family protein